MRLPGYCLLIVMVFIAACDPENGEDKTRGTGSKDKEIVQRSSKHYEGVISNGMKGDKISFDISADGKKLENLTFTGYWRCDGKLESTTAGPEGSFTIINNKVNDHISEPPNGGSTAWRFDLEATIDGDEAEGSFRMNINNLGCDTYRLQWTAAAK